MLWLPWFFWLSGSSCLPWRFTRCLRKLRRGRLKVFRLMCTRFGIFIRQGAMWVLIRPKEQNTILEKWLKKKAKSAWCLCLFGMLRLRRLTIRRQRFLKVSRYGFTSMGSPETFMKWTPLIIMLVCTRWRQGPAMSVPQVHSLCWALRCWLCFLSPAEHDGVYGWWCH